MKIPPNKVGDTIFSSLSDDSVELDIAALESAFAANSASKSRPGAAVKVAAPTFMDPKRSNNIGIMIARLKQKNDELCKAILEVDEEKLPLETLIILKACVPTPEEDAEIDHFEGDKGAVGKAEKFQLEVGGIQYVRERLHLLCWMHEHREQSEALAPDVESVSTALQDLNSSTQFAELLKLVLALGNYMNGGSSRGGAAGFKLDTLNKLDAVKSPQQKSKTLLDFLVKLVKEKHPAIAEHVEAELHAVEKASKVAFSNIATELGLIKRSLQAAQSEMQTLNSDVAGSG